MKLSNQNFFTTIREKKQSEFPSKSADLEELAPAS